MPTPAATLGAAHPVAQGGANFVLQGITLVSKAVLLLVLARWLQPEEVGIFGLLAATLAFSMFLVGFDFHAFSAREMLSGDLADAPRLFRDQVVFHGVFYLVALPALWLVFASSILPRSVALVFYVLVVMEHASQELQRLLITLSRSTAAAVMMFLRGGAWVWFLFAAFVIWTPSRSVGFTAWSWVVGSTLALAFGLASLRDLDWARAWRSPIRWEWVRAGVLAAVPFLLASLALRGTQTVDRYALKWYVGDRAVGVYTVYAAASAAVVGFVEAGIIFVLRPSVVMAYRTGDLERYRGGMRTMATAAITGAVTLGLLAALLARPVLGLLGDPVYLSALPALWILLGAAVMIVAVHLVDTMLYVRERDRSIALGAGGAFLVVAILSGILVPTGGITGAAVSLAAGIGAGLLAKMALLARSA